MKSAASRRPSSVKVDEENCRFDEKRDKIVDKSRKK
jgi:hypothetical protein